MAQSHDSRVDDLVVGAVHCWSLRRPIDRMDLVRYAGSSGDLNPMHLDDEFAQAAGYDRVFGHGMYTAAQLARFVTDWHGAGNVRRFGVQFRERAQLGDVLTFSGTVVTVDVGRGSADVRLEVTNQDGRVVLRGSANVALPQSTVGVS